MHHDWMTAQGCVVVELVEYGLVPVPARVVEMALFSNRALLSMHPSFEFEACSYALLLRRRTLVPILDAIP
jgi:hypothetical protein